MSTDSQTLISSDVTIIDLLRKQDSMTIQALADALGVTATAVRQRLNRLMAQGMIERAATPAGRGRPSHQYSLTSKGRRQSGANFGDLAIALWEEIRSIEDPTVRSGLMSRIAKRLADMYAPSIRGGTVQQRLEAIQQLFDERQLPVEVADEDGVPTLQVLACPYPDLAEQDRGVCSMEKLLFTELLGETVKLSECRLDGANCCTFETKGQGVETWSISPVDEGKT